MFRIIMPLSLPVMAVVALWSAVGHWNSWFDAMIYCRSRENSVLMYVLRRILLEQQKDESMMANMVLTRVGARTTPETVKMATIVVASFPIVAAYPFLQKYFVKGILIGALKG